jgi:DegV family protein with EDD domain
MAIKIVTDSTVGLTDAFINEHDLRLVPLTVTFGDQSYRERFELTNDQFYARLKRSATLPKTSQPSPGQFLAVYDELLSQGHEIISIHLSGGYTGTVDAARSAAAELCDGQEGRSARIHIVDTRLTSPVLDMIVSKAVRAAEEGRDASWIIDQVERMARNTSLILVLDTLEFLEKGGRIGPARALLGTMLKIKPILQFESGVAVPLTTVRTRSRALAYLVDYYVQRAGGEPVWLALGHAQAPDDLAQVRQAVCERLTVAECWTTEVGPVLGTYGGPGVLGGGVCRVSAAPWQ